jgi:hypothetical protein
MKERAHHALARALNKMIKDHKERIKAHEKKFPRNVSSDRAVS